MISIIVPIYNTEKYLSECIDSILAQSYTDFEVLLVDDGSTDKSGEICDEYAKTDSRVRVFHKANGGVSSARNVGLDNAQGEWVCFVDSDDTIPMDTLDSYASSISDNTDLVMSAYEVRNESGEIIRKYTKYDDRLFSQCDFLKEMYARRIEEYQGYIWNKLFRRSVIELYKLRFNEDIVFNEDRLFIVQFVCKTVNPIFFLNHVTYSYLEHANNAMSSLQKAYNSKFVTDLDALILMKKEIDNLSFGNELRWVTIGGIRNSYEWNHRLMMQHGVYDGKNHWYMVWKMIRNGIFFLHLKDTARPLINLLFPRLYIKKGLRNKYIDTCFNRYEE